jgi:hypothetical protein
MGISAASESDSSCQEFQDPSTHVSDTVEVILYHVESFGIQI